MENLDAAHAQDDQVAPDSRARWYRPAALSTQHSRRQLTIATALLTAIPLLSIAFLTLVNFSDYDYSLGTQIAVALFGLYLGATGYAILRQYPRNLERLNETLRLIAEGKLPEHVDLIKSAGDIRDIERYLNRVVGDLRSKVDRLERALGEAETMQRIIAQQNDDLIEAERVRVMVESLGAACHHIGQPATVLQMTISLLQNQLTGEEHQTMLKACEDATGQIADVLGRLRKLSDYRTVPYRPMQQDELPGGRILDISAPTLTG